MTPNEERLMKLCLVRLANCGCTENDDLIADLEAAAKAGRPNEERLRQAIKRLLATAGKPCTCDDETVECVYHSAHDFARAALRSESEQAAPVMQTVKPCTCLLRDGK